MVAAGPLTIRTSPSLFLSQQSVKTAASDFDIHDPDFIASIPRILCATLGKRQGGDAELHIQVKGEVAQGESGQKKLYLVEDEMQFRRNEEGTILLHIAKLMTRLARGEKLDIAAINDTLERQQAAEEEQLRQQCAAEDVRRRIEDGNRLGLRNARVPSTHDRSRYPGTPDAKSLASSRSKDQYPRRRAESSAHGSASVQKVAAVFNACHRITAERQRRLEEEAEDCLHAHTHMSKESIVEPDVEDSSDEEDYGTEIVVRRDIEAVFDETVRTAAPSVALAAPPMGKKKAAQENEATKTVSIHGNFVDTMRVVQAATPQKKRLLLEDLRAQWEQVRNDVDRAVHDWDKVKKTIASTSTRAKAAHVRYTSAWATFEARKQATPAMSFAMFPWPMLIAPRSIQEITRENVEEFLFHEGDKDRLKIVRDSLALWHESNFAKLDVMRNVAARDHDTVYVGQAKVLAVLQELKEQEDEGCFITGA